MNDEGLDDGASWEEYQATHKENIELRVRITALEEGLRELHDEVGHFPALMSRDYTGGINVSARVLRRLFALLQKGSTR